MRARTLKPELLRGPLGTSSPTAQLVALVLMVHADDEGYFVADPALVRAGVLPHWQNLSEIEAALADLQGIGFVMLATHPDGMRLGKIWDWPKWQSVQHPKPSKIGPKFFECELESRPMDSVKAIIEPAVEAASKEPPKRKRPYVLIGNEPFAECMARIED